MSRVLLINGSPHAEGSEASPAMQKKPGLRISSGTVYWLRRGE